MRSAFEAAEGSYNILCVSSVSSPIYRVFRKIAGNTSFVYTSNYSEVPIGITYPVVANIHWCQIGRSRRVIVRLKAISALDSEGLEKRFCHNLLIKKEL